MKLKLKQGKKSVWPKSSNLFDEDDVAYIALQIVIYKDQPKNSAQIMSTGFA